MNLLEWLDGDASLLLMRVMTHFLWQGAAVAAVTMAVLWGLKGSTSRRRYAAALAGLIFLAACPPATLWRLAPSAPPARALVAGRPLALVEDVGDGSQAAPATPETGGGGEMKAYPASNSAVELTASLAPKTGEAPPATFGPQETAASPSAADDHDVQRRLARAVTGAYMAGVGLMILRLVLGLHGGRRLRRHSSLLSTSEIPVDIARLARAVGLRFTPVVGWCERVAAPVVVGLVRPMILLPPSLATGLSAGQVEAVLLHEMAHIRRLDPLVSLIQRVIESLLFFHPAMWWLSRQVRIEREHCCDDLATAAGAAPADYADMLLRVAEIGLRRRRSRSGALEAVAADGGRPSNLGVRIARLIGHPLGRRYRLKRSWMLLAVVAVAVAVALGKCEKAPSDGTFHTSASPDDVVAAQIRLAAVRPDSGDDLYDAAGKKIGVERPRWLQTWPSDKQHRQFIFSAPDLPDPIIPLSSALVRIAGGGQVVGAGFCRGLEAGSDRAPRLTLNAELPKTYSRKVAGLFRQDVPVEKVDVTLKFYQGAPGKAAYTFAGPFSLDVPVPSDQDPAVTLTPNLIDWGVEGDQVGFHLSSTSKFIFDKPMLAYDLAGRRYLFSHRSGSTGGGGTELNLGVKGLPLEKIARIVVDETPRTKTFHNIFVGYPDRTQPAYFDELVDRLGLTGMSRQQLGNYRFKNAAEVVKAIDIVRGQHIPRAAELLTLRDSAIDFATLDVATREKIRKTAQAWLDEGFVAEGLVVGMKGRWPEFYAAAITALAEPDRLDRNGVGSVYSSLLQNRDGLPDSELDALVDLLQQTENGDVCRWVMGCLEVRTPAATTALWKLAESPDAKAWLWASALRMLASRGELPAPSELPAGMALRHAVGRPGSPKPPLTDASRRLLDKALTPKLMRMNPWLFENFFEQRFATAGPEATDAFIELLRGVEDPSRSSFQIRKMVDRINAWHGVNIGGLADVRGEDILNRMRIDWSEVVAEALAWREKGIHRRTLPAGYTPGSEAMRFIWRDRDQPENSVIVACDLPKTAGGESIQIPLAFAGDFLLLRLLRTGAPADRTCRLIWKAGVRDRSHGRKDGPWRVANLPLRLVTGYPPWAGRWDVRAEPFAAMDSVLFGTKLYEAWRSEYVAAGPLIEAKPIVYDHHTDETIGEGLVARGKPYDDWRAVAAAYRQEAERRRAGETILWTSDEERFRTLMARKNHLYRRGLLSDAELLAQCAEFADRAENPAFALEAYMRCGRMQPFRPDTKPRTPERSTFFEDAARRWPDVVTNQTVYARTRMTPRSLDRDIAAYRWLFTRTEAQMMDGVANWTFWAGERPGAPEDQREMRLASLKRSIQNERTTAGHRLANGARSNADLRKIIKAFPDTPAAEAAAKILRVRGADESTVGQE